MTTKIKKVTHVSKRPSNEIILSAIQGSGAVMSTVAKRLKVDWYTAKKYVEAEEITASAFLAEGETVLDMCESTLQSAVKAKDTAAAKWLLATKGKKRGYSEKHEVEHTGKMEIIYLDKQDADL